MSYQVLARKWRPQTFADVVGQEHVLTALANGLSLGRIHHAYLFSGTRGVGKTSIARLLAKGLNCESGITATPCGVCDNCREIEQGRFVDLIEIDAASRTKVEDTRDLLDNVQYAPARGRFKVYLIDEVHMLSRHSFNALLKTLEARAADGSLRDALSLTDQAIASGDGQLTTLAVSTMLGTLDDDQALSLIEAVVEANGEQVMALVNASAARGIEWEALLVEMLSLLHRIAMIQLSPAALGPDMAAIEQRMRELARTIPPTDVQLYYQTLLIGRKELPFAPDRRMGVEMTLLRALAFHPRMPLPEPEVPQPSFAPVAPTAVMTPPQVPVQQSAPPLPRHDVPLSDATSSVLAARNQLQRAQGVTKPKKSEPAAPARARPVNNAALERLASVSERVQSRSTSVTSESQAPAKKEAYRWKATTVTEEVKVEVATPKALKKALEHEKTPELAAKLAGESLERDAWAAEVSQLKLPKLVEQVALNAWREQDGNRICLHLRSGQRHLNSASAQQVLTEALSTLQGAPVELTIIEDDNPAVRTPLEWRQAIYEEKLAQARESIIADNNIQTLQRYFDAELDEESIRPI